METKLTLPKLIIVEDQDEGFIVASLHHIDQLGDGPAIPIYRYKEYYHDLGAAIKGEFK